MLSRTGSGPSLEQGEDRLRTSVDALSPSWSFWNAGVPRCWTSVPAASKMAGGDTGIASRRGRGRLLCSSKQVGVGPRAHSPPSRLAGGHYSGLSLRWEVTLLPLYLQCLGASTSVGSLERCFSEPVLLCVDFISDFWSRCGVTSSSNARFPTCTVSVHTP